MTEPVTDRIEDCLRRASAVMDGVQDDGGPRYFSHDRFIVLAMGWLSEKIECLVVEHRKDRGWYVGHWPVPDRIPPFRSAADQNLAFALAKAVIDVGGG